MLRIFTIVITKLLMVIKLSIRCESVFTQCIVLGVEFPYIPETNGVPIVTDMSSSIMTKKLDISKVTYLKQQEINTI